MRVIPLLLCLVYFVAATAMYLAFPYWMGREKALLLGAYLGTALPGLGLLFRKGPVGELPRLVPLRFLLAASLLVLTGLTAAFNQGGEVPDESVYQFQAATLRTGHLTAPGPPPDILADPALRRAFSFTHTLLIDGRHFGKYPLGYPAVLAAAEAIGVDRIANGFFSWLIVCAAAWLARDLYSPAVAQWTVVVLTASPFFLFNSLGWYAHNLAGALVAWATVAAIASRRRNPVLLSTAAAVALSACLLVRPFVAVVAGVPLGLYALWQHAGRPRVIVTAASTALPLVGLGVTAYLFIQKQLTGGWFTSPYSLYYQSGAIPKEINLSPISLVTNLVTITPSAIADTLLASFPLVLPLAAVALFRFRKQTEPKPALLLASAFFLFVAAYLVQTEISTSAVGDRYYFEAYFAAVIVAVSLPWPRYLLAPCLALITLPQLAIYAKVAHDARRPYAAMAEAARAVSPPTRLVYLEQGDTHFYGSWLNLNPPDWQNVPVLVLIDPGPGHRDRLAQRLGRQQWVLLDWNPETRRVVTFVRESTAGTSGGSAPSGRAGGQAQQSRALREGRAHTLREFPCRSTPGRSPHCG